MRRQALPRGNRCAPSGALGHLTHASAPRTLRHLSPETQNRRHTARQPQGASPYAVGQHIQEEEGHRGSDTKRAEDAADSNAVPRATLALRVQEPQLQRFWKRENGL